MPEENICIIGVLIFIIPQRALIIAQTTVFDKKLIAAFQFETPSNIQLTKICVRPKPQLIIRYEAVSLLFSFLVPSGQ